MSDAQLYESIGRKLHAIMPPDAEKIWARASVGDDWSEVGFEFVDGAGERRWFGMDQHPARAAGDIGEELVALRKLMSGDGRGDWNRCEFAIDRAGTFSVDFAYSDTGE